MNALIDFLMDLAENGCDKDLGIYPLIELRFGNAMANRFLDVAQLWPKHSGDRSCPIPHYELSPRKAYCTQYFWDTSTQYGRDRRELCLWTAIYLKETAQ